MLTYIVVDTGYWLELFKVPGHSKQEYYLAIKERFVIANQNKYRLYLPIPVLFELDKNLNFFVDRFESEFSPQGLGFTGSSIILEAESLKKEINRVHIWTLDTPLKAREPDTESNAFIGV